jgi:hypothetical protein
MSKRLSKEDYKAEKQEQQRTLLADAVEKLTTSKGWREYLDATSKFTSRSFNNRILIALQDPDATLVEGGKTWPKKWTRTMLPEGYDNPIFILAPIMVDLKDGDGKVIMGENDKPKQRVAFYKTVKVYDIRYTEGKEIPTVPMQPLTGDSHEEFMFRATDFIESLGASVREDSVEFYWTQGDSAGGRLTANIDATQAVNHRVRQLIKAAAEIVGNDVAASAEEPLSDRERQVVMESATYIIAQNVGLDTADMSIPYIASWGDEPKEAIKAVRTFAKYIDEVVEKVTGAIS